MIAADLSSSAPAEEDWFTETEYLKQLKATHRARARAAMRWRPRLLKALAMSCQLTLALRAARVAYNTVRAHERNDPEFAAQLKQAEDEGAELLHDVCFKTALEGNLEPVYFQGEIVDYIRKYDSRMQIEMLRAHMPKTFKTPGAKVAINACNVTNNTMIITPEEQQNLIELRRESLRRIYAKKGLPLPAELVEGGA